MMNKYQVPLTVGKETKKLLREVADELELPEFCFTQHVNFIIRALINSIMSMGMNEIRMLLVNHCDEQIENCDLNEMKQTVWKIRRKWLMDRITELTGRV